MPRVLMLARQFPPIGGAGVHRTVGSVRYLPAHGYQPVVVTSAARYRDRWQPRDDDLLELIPAEIPVHRVPEPAPAPHSRLERVRGTAPPWVRSWVEECARLGTAVGGGADLVYASCLPYETTTAAARVGAALGRPWVADLEDAWAFDEMRLPLSAWHRREDLRRMRLALAGASAIVMAAPEAAERLRAAMPELASRIAVIPIGFEPDEFTARPPDRDAGTFRIVHTGSLHTDLGTHLRRTRGRRRLLGGTTPGLDVLTRSHVFLVEAIARLIAARPALGGRIELHLAGELTAHDRAVAERHAFVRIRGLLPHRAAIELMRSADLLFLPMHDLPAGTRATLIPYKTYEYLGSRRPILGAVPDGDVRDMLAPLSQVSLVRPPDVTGIAAAIDARLTAVAAAPGGREPDTDPPTAYERPRCAEQIARLLDGVLGVGPGLG